MLTLVPTPIGNVEDITYRAVEALKRAQVYLCEDTRVAKKLFSLIKERFGVELLTPSKKVISLHQHNQSRFLKEIDPAFFEREVVYLSDAGMPAISDPGAALVRYCRKNGVEYDVLPGASAFVTAFAASGFEGPFTFYGFLPSRGKERSVELKRILNSNTHAIVYEAPHRIEELIETIAKNHPDRELFAAKELTKKFQRYFAGRAEDILKEFSEISKKGEWVVIISANRDSCDIEEILNLELPIGKKAKLLAEATGESAKSWYRKLLKDNN